MEKQVILAFETSCDETAAAVYASDQGVLSNKLFSQIALHSQFGGVVPEIASRSHIQKINSITQEALDAAGLTLDDINIIAVTTKPGLPGSLLVGVCFAKTIAWALKKKLIGVNHLEGHAFSACIENNIPFPFLCLTASGGHTSMYIVNGFGDYHVIGQTTDDAAGEAFDKVAKLIGLPYPGGPVIEKLAQKVDFQDFYHYPRGNAKTLNFSFSGLKTAVMYDLVKRGLYSMQTRELSQTMTDQHRIHVASSLLVAIKDIFINKIDYALAHYPVKAIAFVGGVACNKFIRHHLAQYAAQHNLPFFTPSAQYCTDNAAMIAFVAHYKAKQGLFDSYNLDIL